MLWPSGSRTAVAKDVQRNEAVLKVHRMRMRVALALAQAKRSELTKLRALALQHDVDLRCAVGMCRGRPGWGGVG